MIAFQDKVTTQHDDTLKGDAAIVTITLKNGTSHTCRIDHCIGSAANPMTNDQLTHKFTNLAEPVIGPSRTKEMVERGWATESAADVGDTARAAA